MADIFISYAREDREHAKELAEILAEHGWSVWWDRLINTGAAFNRVIEAELNGAKCVVVLLSGPSVGSNYVMNEAAEADARGVLVPVLIEDVRVPLPFRHLQATPVEEMDHVVASIRSLVESGGGTRRALPTPPPRRMSIWVPAAVIAVLIAMIVMIANNAVERSTPSIADQTVDTAPVVDTTTRTRPRPMFADKVLDLTLRPDSGPIQKRRLVNYVGTGTGFVFDGSVEVRNQNVSLNIQCVKLACDDVTVSVGSTVIPPVRTGSFKIPAASISAAGTRVRVLAKGTEAFRFTLVDRSSDLPAVKTRD